MIQKVIVSQVMIFTKMLFPEKPTVIDKWVYVNTYFRFNVPPNLSLFDCLMFSTDIMTFSDDLLLDGIILKGMIKGDHLRQHDKVKVSVRTSSFVYSFLSYATRIFNSRYNKYLLIMELFCNLITYYKFLNET